MSNVSVAHHAQARLGECALWSETQQALYWTDIEGSKISRLGLVGDLREWTLPERVGCFAFCAGNDDRLLLGLASGISVFDTRTGEATPVIPVEAEHPSTRINDGRCDRQGRFVFGTFNPAEKAIGGFWRVHPDLSIERLPLPAAAVGNSICFSPDGGTMYYTDTPTRIICRLDYHPDGRIGAPQVFVRLAPHDGFADGSCVDAEGGLWNAQWDGRCVVRYDASGAETVRITLPVSRPTCPAFGGAALDRLYVTSARQGLSSTHLEKEPVAGAVLAVDGVAWRGLPETRFVLQP